MTVCNMSCLVDNIQFRANFHRRRGRNYAPSLSHWLSQRHPKSSFNYATLLLNISTWVSVFAFQTMQHRLLSIDVNGKYISEEDACWEMTLQSLESHTRGEQTREVILTDCQVPAHFLPVTSILQLSCRRSALATEVLCHFHCCHLHTVYE